MKKIFKFNKLIIISDGIYDDIFDFKNVQTEHYKINSKGKLNKFVEIIFLILKNLIKNNNNKTQYIFIDNPICRIAFIFYFFFKKKHFVYLEIPSNLFYFYDFILFRVVSNIFFTSNLRAKYIKQKYYLKKKKIFSYTFRKNLKINKLNRYNKIQKKNIVFIGTLHKKIPQDILNFLIKYKIKLSVFTTNNVQNKNVFLKKYVSFNNPIFFRKKLLSVLQKHKYGLLFYPITSVNNNLCTPMKIYDYIAADLIMISFYKNKALKVFKKQYPNLIYFYDNQLNLKKIKKNSFYFKQKKNFFENVNKEMKKFDKLFLEYN